MKYLLISITFLLLLSLHSQAQKNAELPSDWKLISGCTVSIYAPFDIEFREDNSSDNCQRDYRGKNISIQLYVTPFKIGASRYSNWLEYCVTKTNVNTKDAEIVTQHIPVTAAEYYGLDYMAMLLVPHFREGSGNLIITAWSKTSEDRDRAIKILKSVQFDKK